MTKRRSSINTFPCNIDISRAKHAHSYPECFSRSRRYRRKRFSDIRGCTYAALISSMRYHKTKHLSGWRNRVTVPSAVCVGVRIVRSGKVQEILPVEKEAASYGSDIAVQFMSPEKGNPVLVQH